MKAAQTDRLHRRQLEQIERDGSVAFGKATEFRSSEIGTFLGREGRGDEREGRGAKAGTKAPKAARESRAKKRVARRLRFLAIAVALEADPAP